MLSSLRLALRSLARSRGFALTAVLTLAVGIGSTTAIFSVLQALVISPFAYPAADRLVYVWSGGTGWSLSPADSFDIRKEVSSFAAFGVYQPQSYNVGSENARSVTGVSGTADVLRAYGVPPMLGRWFVPALAAAFRRRPFGRRPEAARQRPRRRGGRRHARWL